MGANKTVTATFNENPDDPEKYTLTILVVGNGTLTPTNGTYNAGTTINLQATSAEGWTFSGWTGDKTATTNTTTLVMDSDKVVTATFTNEIIPEFPSTSILAALMILATALCITLRRKINPQT
jgi:uncharacterized repeat protein (TIGR02543 family)